MAHWLPSLMGLRTFEAVARHLSFAAAAEELAVTQTAVSHQIRRLEEQLGVRLFHRHGRRVQLTRAGEANLPGVRAGFDALRRATGAFFRDQGGGPLSVSTITSLAATRLAPRLAAFQPRHPEITVHVSTTGALVDFERDEIDLAIRYGLGSWPGLSATRLMSDDIFPVTRFC